MSVLLVCSTGWLSNVIDLFSSFFLFFFFFSLPRNCRYIWLCKYSVYSPAPPPNPPHFVTPISMSPLTLVMLNSKQLHQREKVTFLFEKKKEKRMAATSLDVGCEWMVGNGPALVNERGGDCLFIHKCKQESGSLDSALTGSPRLKSEVICKKRSH